MMEQEVFRKDSAFELALNITHKRDPSTVLVSKEYELKNSVIFQVKHTEYLVKTSNGYNISEKYYNVIAIRVKKIDPSDSFYSSIKLSCEMFGLKKHKYEVDHGSWRIINENNESDYKFVITVHMQIDTQLSPFAVLYEDTKCVDFKIKSPDGEIGIHKAFLAVTSKSFYSKLDTMSDDFIEIPDTNVQALQDFKQYFYLNILPEEKKKLENLLLLASFFNIKLMEFKCVDKLLSNVSSSDALELLEFALNHKLMTLFLGILEKVQSKNLKVSEIRKFYLRK